MGEEVGNAIQCWKMQSDALRAKEQKAQVQDWRDDTGVSGGRKGPGNMDAQQHQAPYTMRKSGEESQHGTGHDFEGIPLHNQGYAGTAL